MKDSSRKREKVVLGIGLFFIFLGIICNEWTLTKFISPVDLPLPARIVIWIANLALMVLGVMFVYFRKNTQIILNISLLVAILALCLVLGEVFLRFEVTKVEKLKLFRENPYGTGSFRLKPNLYVITKVEKQNVIIKINSHGMRWREVSPDNLLKKRE